MSIRVIIAGFKGKMGQAACQMVLADPDKMPKIKAELEKQPFKGKLHDLQVDTQGVRVEAK